MVLGGVIGEDEFWAIRAQEEAKEEEDEAGPAQMREAQQWAPWAHGEGRGAAEKEARAAWPAEVGAWKPAG